MEQLVLNCWRDRNHRCESFDFSPLVYHRKLPSYGRTSLHSFPELAEEIGVGAVLVKDESRRLTLPAFKILGASWAIWQLLERELGIRESDWKTIEELRDVVASSGKRIRFVTATDGNHGRGVARMAKWLGVEAIVYMPRGTVQQRIDAIASEGATVTVVSGNYDLAVETASSRQDAETFLIQDTSWEGYEDVPGWIVEGYSTLMAEIDESIEEQRLPTPTHVLVPVGVGALAGAVLRHYRNDCLEVQPQVIGVEPEEVACAVESLKEGRSTSITGEPETIMAGLNCGTLASIVWTDLRAGMDAAMAIADHWAEEAMRRYAALGLKTCESGASTLAGLLALSQQNMFREHWSGLELNSSSTVLLFMTEGVTDPSAFFKITES